MGKNSNSGQDKIQKDYVRLGEVKNLIELCIGQRTSVVYKQQWAVREIIEVVYAAKLSF